MELLIWRELHPGTKKPIGRKWPAMVDLWSIAIMLFECATGKLPFRAKTDSALYRMVTEKTKGQIWGWEFADGEFFYGYSIPTHEITRFYIEFAQLLDELLQVSKIVQSGF